MNEKKIILYRTSWCPYCHLAKRLLTSKGVAHEDIDLDGDPELRADVARRSGRGTVPQIFIDDLPLGGYDELAELDRRGELDALLGLSSDENHGG